MTSTDVIVYHLNYGRYLAECLESIRKQNVDKTVYLIDGGSTDETFIILEQYPEVKVHKVEGNIRVAVNYGLSNSFGDYIVCFASDNMMFLNYLAKAKQILDANPDVGLVYGGAAEIDEKSQKTGRLLPHGGHFTRSRLLQSNFIDFSEGVFRRECLKDTGLIPGDITYHLDWYIWLKISEHWRVVGLGCPVIYYRVHSKSHSSLKQWEIAEEYVRLKAKLNGGKL